MNRASDRYVVAIKPADSRYWVFNGGITQEQMRADYDRGLCELAQRKLPDGSWEQLRIPRKTRAERTPTERFGRRPATVEAA